MPKLIAFALLFLLQLTPYFVSIAAEPRQPEITFLAVKDAKTVLLDESQEPYFSRMQPVEMVTKVGRPLTSVKLQAKQDEIRKEYAKSVMDYTDAEKKWLGDLVGEAQAILSLSPHFTKTEWKFIKVASNIEGGLPHTRGDAIVFSEGLLKKFAEGLGASNPAAKQFIKRKLIQLLVHEQMHVLQRQQPKLFKKLYAAWGFEKAKKVELGEWLTRRQMLNPDGLELDWVYKEGGKKYLPMVVLKRTDGVPRMPHDFQTIAVELEATSPGNYKAKLSQKKEKDGVPVPLFVAIPELTDFCKQFGIPALSGYGYHPNEIAANLMQNLGYYKKTLKKEDYETQATKIQASGMENVSRFIEWLEPVK